jgi:hypothetical protein
VLTVAHNIIDEDTRQLFGKIHFFPGVNGELKDPYEVADIYIPGQYCLNPKTESDFALLKLKRRVPL